MPKLYEVVRSHSIKAGQIVEVVGFVYVDKVIMAICLWEGVLLDVPFGYLSEHNYKMNPFKQIEQLQNAMVKSGKIIELVDRLLSDDSFMFDEFKDQYNKIMRCVLGNFYDQEILKYRRLLESSRESMQSWLDSDLCDCGNDEHVCGRDLLNKLISDIDIQLGFQKLSFYNVNLGEGFESAEKIRDKDSEIIQSIVSAATETALFNRDSIGSLYITFGQDHIHKLGNQVFDKDCIAEISCKTISEGREIASDLFGDKFFTSYTKDQLPNMRHFPRGIIKTEVACNRSKKYKCPEYEKFRTKESANDLSRSIVTNKESDKEKVKRLLYCLAIIDQIISDSYNPGESVDIDAIKVYVDLGLK